MAFRRRSFGFKRHTFGASRKQVPRWFAQSFDTQLAAGTASSTAIVDPATLAVGSGNMEQECLLVRLVGAVSVRTLAAGAIGTSVGIGVIKTAATNVVVGGFNDPLIPAELGTKDWLQMLNTDVPANAGANGWMIRIPFDIRVKRRLKSPEQIRFIASNLAGGDTVIVAIDIRILITIRI